MRRVEVVWLDSIGLNDGGWASRKEHEDSLDPEKLVIHSCGHLYAENDDVLMLALSVHEDNAADVMAIPKVAIRSIKELEVSNGGTPDLLGN